VKPAALVLGGTGFVGPHLARQLEDRYSVTLTGRADDIRDSAKVLELVGRLKPQIVVNLAAITTVRESFENPRETYDIGFYGLLNLFEALAAWGFAGRVLHASSSEVYGHPHRNELPLSETAPLRAMSPYSVAKLAGEMLCHQWSCSGAFAVFVARPFTHIGPGQSDRFAVARYAQQIAEIKAGRRAPIVQVGSLTATRDLTDVRDVARAYDLILHDGTSGRVYNVCSGCEVAMREVFEQLVRISGVDIEVEEDMSLMRSSEQQRVCGSYAKIHAETGWAPRVPLVRTLADMLEASSHRAGVP
jgi:GDP-4-dehydro-6-deoxy-D-mannose reductase